jgi:hypothetical protein
LYLRSAADGIYGKLRSITNVTNPKVAALLWRAACLVADHTLAEQWVMDAATASVKVKIKPVRRFVELICDAVQDAGGDAVRIRHHLYGPPEDAVKP